MSFGTVLIAVGAICLICVAGTQLGMWLARNRRRYKLVDDRALLQAMKHSMAEPAGVPVSQTPSGRRWELIVQGVCPNCRTNTKFLAGPEGGLSQNIQCETCGFWFNVSPIGIADEIGFKSPDDDKLNSQRRKLQ